MTGILLVVDDPGWRRFRGLSRKLTGAASLAAKKAGFGKDACLTVLLSSDRKLKSLNRKFRGRDKTTNVLSFPAPSNPEGYRGDVAIALGVARREAKAQGKSLADHASHLVVHGILHLAGYDHVKRTDAKVMEPLEVEILERLGIGDPYLACP
jgi:probable rRNA maturation factor